MNSYEIEGVGRFYADGQGEADLMQDAIKSAKVAVVTHNHGAPQVTFVTQDDGSSLSGPMLAHYKEGMRTEAWTSHGTDSMSAGVAAITSDIPGAVKIMCDYVDSVI